MKAGEIVWQYRVVRVVCSGPLLTVLYCFILYNISINIIFNP